MQVTSALSGGGNGRVSATNEHLSQVQETGSATSRVGNSIALAPTPVPGASPAAGVTTASSGAATGTGVTADNTVNNTQAGAIRVGDQSQAPLAVTTHSEALVNDTAASLAQSGQAWAVAAGAKGAPSNVNTPVTTGAAPTSGAVSVTGLTAQNTVSTSSSATVTVPGSSAPTTPITVKPSDAVSIVNGATAAASSGGACAGAQCGPGVSAAAAGTTAAADAARAASGATTAQGVVAQNTVNTNANVSVKVAGQNFAPIQVIIDSVTQVLNWGAGAASSGDTTATGGGTGTTAQSTTSASSGDVQVTGATVQNTVNMRSSAAVHVAGDNYNPINVVLNLAADVLNWGIGAGQSGDAQTTGAGGGGSATSGRVSATGLQVVNLVNMWADASVDIDGNNYAPITIEIDFNTRIRNYGAASAASGNVAAGQSGQSSSSSGSASSHTGSQNGAGTNASSGGTSSSGSSSSKFGARGGNTVSVGNSADATISSQQIAGGNGGGAVSSTLITQLLQSLPSDPANPLLQQQQQLPSAATPTPEAGVTSTGGDSVARGMHTTLDQQNVQLAACQSPGATCLARNIAAMTFSSADVPNPLEGGSSGSSNTCGICASGSFVGVNATPTPTPSPSNGISGVKKGSGNINGSNSGGQSSSSHRRTTNVTYGTFSDALLPSGYTVDVDLWDQWPGRRLPPMPNLQTQKPASGDVNVSFDTWPAADELPVPGLVEVDGASAAGPAPSGQPSVPARLIRSASADQTAVASGDGEDDGPLPLLGVYNVSASWPDAEALPVPSPAARVAVAAAPADVTADQAAAPASDQSDADNAGPGGLATLPLAVAGTVLALLGASRRGRLFLSTLWGQTSSSVGALRQRLLLAPRQRLLAGGARRRLTALRLILGALRLWLLSVLRLG